MKQHNKSDLVQYRISKSKEASYDAKLALENERYANALNRIYYSIFYIVSALALKYDFSTSKHKQLLGWFNFNFVKNGLIDHKLNEIYKNAYDNRQEADYEDFIEYEKMEIELSYSESLYFISELESIINSDSIVT